MILLYKTQIFYMFQLKIRIIFNIKSKAVCYIIIILYPAHNSLHVVLPSLIINKKIHDRNVNVLYNNANPDTSNKRPL